MGVKWSNSAPKSQEIRKYSQYQYFWCNKIYNTLYTSNLKIYIYKLSYDAKPVLNLSVLPKTMTFWIYSTRHRSFYLEKGYELLLYTFDTLASRNIDTTNIFQFLVIFVQNWTTLPQTITSLTNLACQSVISYITSKLRTTHMQKFTPFYTNL